MLLIARQTQNVVNQLSRDIRLVAATLRCDGLHPPITSLKTMGVASRATHQRRYGIWVLRRSTCTKYPGWNVTGELAGALLDGCYGQS